MKVKVSELSNEISMMVNAKGTQASVTPKFYPVPGNGVLIVNEFIHAPL